MKVSVVISCYNLEKYISRAINSCIHQTLEADQYEIIVVDDASSDESWETIKSFGTLVSPHKHDKNLGVAAASNTVIRNARGKYVVRVDGDDFINKNFLHTLTQFLDWNEDIGFVYCDHIVVNENLERKQSMNTLEKLLDHGAGVMFRREHLEELGLYDETLRNREDYDLILRYIERFKKFERHHVRLPYYRYFKREGSLSSDKKTRKELKDKIESRSKA